MSIYSQARSSVPPPPPNSINEYSKVESVDSCRFLMHLYILACIMSREFTRDSVMKFLPAQFPLIWCKCLLRILSHSKIFNLTKYRQVLVKLFTARYACSNSDLNLTLVTGTTNGFIFQIINSLIECWGVRLTCFDCNKSTTISHGLHSYRR